MRTYEVEIYFTGKTRILVEAEDGPSARTIAEDEWIPEDYLAVWAEASCPPFGPLVSAEVECAVDYTVCRPVPLDPEIDPLEIWSSV